MPELPEVEHVVRALRSTITGRRIISAELKLARIAANVPSSLFNRKIRGAQIESVTRRGKYILIELDNKRALLVHLRMTGKFVVLTIDQFLPPHAHVIFYLDDDRRLVFCDMRQFGRMIVVAASKLQQTRQLSELAPEPLSEEFSIEYFLATLARSPAQATPAGPNEDTGTGKHLRRRSTVPGAHQSLCGSCKTFKSARHPTAPGNSTNFGRSN